MKRSNGKCKGPRMIQEIKRMNELGISRRKIALALSISRNTVDRYLEISDAPAVAPVAYSAPWSARVEWSSVKTATEKGVCLHHYWEESSQATPGEDFVPYVSFWREYKRRYPMIPIDFHKTHPPGERCEVDFKGESKGLGFTDKNTGLFVPCRLFGAILCFSQYFYVRASLDEKQPSFLEGVAKAFEFFGGVPETMAVDNAKVQVTHAHRYDADMNPEFFKFANHFNVAALAMRPGEPKDKNLIENILGVFWRWVGPKIRAQKFYSLSEINAFLLRHLELFLVRIQKKYGTSRREKFTNGEKSLLKPLPEIPFEYGVWTTAKVHPDCHIQVVKNFYSVPYACAGKSLNVRTTNHMIEVFDGLDRVAIHSKRPISQSGCYTTSDIHLPAKHLAIKQATPQKLVLDAESIGAATHQVIKSLLESPHHHPFTYLRRCQGILRFAKRYSPGELESACVTILNLKKENPRLNDIEGIITYNRVGTKQKPINRQSNPNLRGQDSWRSTDS